MGLRIALVALGGGIGAPTRYLDGSRGVSLGNAVANNGLRLMLVLLGMWLGQASWVQARGAAVRE